MEHVVESAVAVLCSWLYNINCIQPQGQPPFPREKLWVRPLVWERDAEEQILDL
jgi:hypothetical protein